MKVAIDISPLHRFSHGRGIGVYTNELLTALKKLDDGNDYRLVKKQQSYDADVIHYPFFDLFFTTLPLVKPRPTVVTIHDVIPLLYPDKYPPGIRGKLKFKIQEQSLKSVKKVVTDSNTSRQDILEHLPVSPSQVETVYLGVNTELFSPAATKEVEATRKHYGLEKPYLLYVGDINYNKNLPSLVRAFARLNTPHLLVLVSGALAQPIPEAQLVHRAIAKENAEDKVVILPRIPFIDLISLYTGAEWYVQPSLYEGFGLPVLEAMACHTPVICSSGGSLGELYSEAALMFDPNNEENMYAVLKQAVTNTDSIRKVYTNKGIQIVNEFQWSTTAQKMSDLYRKAVS